MKKTLTLRELEIYYEKEKPSKIIYCSDNQERKDDELSFCHINITFHTMLVSMWPNVVFLKSDLVTMGVYGVRKVEIDTEASVLGAVLTVSSYSCAGVSSPQKYVFILQ